MAITRAQQAKQMLQKGGRIGFKGGADMGTVSTKDRKATAKSVSISPSGDVRTSKTSGPPDQSSPERDTGLERIRQRNITKLDEFKEYKPTVKKSPGLLGFFNKPFQKLNDLTTARNRKFFENVIRAGKIPGLNFANLDSITSKELEDIYQDYMDRRLKGEIDAMGNPLYRGDDDKNIIPIIPKLIEEEQIETPEYVNPLSLLTTRIAGSQFVANGGRIGAMNGGIMNVEDLDREAFLLGGLAKGLKKAVRGVKKLAKSPIGKMALTAAAIKFGGGLGGLRGTLFGQAGSRVGEAFVPFKEGLFTKLGLTKGGGSLIPTLKGGIALASILPLLAGKTDEEKDDILKDYYASQELSPATTARQAGSEFDFYNYNLAEGGTPRKEPVAKKVMPLLDMNGMEKDYRAEGGFVPIGRMEKADDVPARLSKNEFVFTADAVRNAGDGDVDKGAEVMYNMMKNLEAGGGVSEESQGLDGAREMFQTSQRLGEVI